MDRLVVFIEGNWWCRQCGAKGWWTTQPISAERLAEIKAERRQSQLALVEAMHACQDWMAYHDAPSTYSLWADQGITEREVKRWGLGFCPACPTIPQSPSLTIPVFYKNKLFDIRHRLLEKLESGAKYCSHLAHLTPSFFNLDSSQGQPQVYIVEGEKKVITCTSAGLQAVVGVPGASFYQRLVPVLERITQPHQELIFVPDPGTTDKVQAAVENLRTHKTFIVELWEKPDDFIRLFGPDKFLHTLAYRRPI